MGELEDGCLRFQYVGTAEGAWGCDWGRIRLVNCCRHLVALAVGVVLGSLGDCGLLCTIPIG